MSEPYELIDEVERDFYNIIIKELRKQKRTIFDDPEIVFSGTFWDKEAQRMQEAFAPFIEKITKDAIRLSVADLNLE